MSERHNQIITPADSRHLERLHLISPAPYGWHNVSRCALYPETYKISRSLVDHGFDSSDSPTVTIPVLLESAQTLQFLGFSDQKAAELWASWEGGNITGDFFQLAQSQIKSYAGDVSDGHGDAGFTFLENLGINRETSAAIMESVLEDKSCKQLVLDTVETRYEALRKFYEASRARERFLPSSQELIAAHDSNISISQNR